MCVLRNSRCPWRDNSKGQTTAPIGINKLRTKKKLPEWCTVPPGLGESEVRSFSMHTLSIYMYLFFSELLLLH